MGDQETSSSESMNATNSASPERPPEKAPTPEPPPQQQQQQRDEEERQEDRQDVLQEQQQQQPMQQPKKLDVIFLRSEQIPYLYEVLRGKDPDAPMSNFIMCSDSICDEYIEFVARTGRPIFEWSVLKPLFLYKLESILFEISQVGPFDHLPNVPNTDRSSSRQYIERILSASRSLSGVPFTIQRICELLVQPKKHYKRADKFYRALEKNITVVTTVDSEGRRETERQPEPMAETVIPEDSTNSRENERPESMDETVIRENSVNSLTPEKSPYNHTPQ